VPDRVQIDTTLNRQNCIQNHAVNGKRPGLNRTTVIDQVKSSIVKPAIAVATIGAEIEIGRATP
jgi:hypothetical protein